MKHTSWIPSFLPGGSFLTYFQRSFRVVGVLAVVGLICSWSAVAAVTLTQEKIESQTQGAGAPDGEAISQAIEARKGEIDDCFRERFPKEMTSKPGAAKPGKKKGRSSSPKKVKGASRKPSAVGDSVLAAIQINGQGQAESVKYTQSRVSNPRIEECLTIVLKRVRFPVVQGQGYEIEYPLELKGLSL